MSTLTDKAWESLQNDETVFEVGVCTFNGCNVKVIKRQEPYHYVTKTGKPATKSARYWWKSPVCVTPEAQVPLTLESKFRMTPIKS